MRSWVTWPGVWFLGRNFIFLIKGEIGYCNIIYRGVSVSFLTFWEDLISTLVEAGEVRDGSCLLILLDLVLRSLLAGFPAIDDLLKRI